MIIFKTLINFNIFKKINHFKKCNHFCNIFTCTGKYFKEYVPCTCIINIANYKYVFFFKLVENSQVLEYILLTHFFYWSIHYIDNDIKNNFQYNYIIIIWIKMSLHKFVMNYQFICWRKYYFLGIIGIKNLKIWTLNFKKGQSLRYTLPFLRLNLF